MNKRTTLALLALSALAFGCVLAMSTPAAATTTITLGEQNFADGTLVSPGDYSAAQGDDTNPPTGGLLTRPTASTTGSVPRSTSPGPSAATGSSPPPLLRPR